MKIFILEDDPNRVDAFMHVLRGHDLFIANWVEGKGGAKEKFTKYQPFDLMLLDHDLGGGHYIDSKEEETGASFCRWLEPVTRDTILEVVVHSWNHGGSTNMQADLLSKGFSVVRIPFGRSLLAWLEAHIERSDVSRRRHSDTERSES